jgi:hypothetical protein
VSPAWGVYEGAGPLCRSERCFSARDFECPPSPPLKEVLSSELEDKGTEHIFAFITQHSKLRTR